MTLREFKEQCQAEDSYIQQLKFIQDEKEIINEDNVSLYNLLTNHGDL